jgi:hypothetical protein
VEFSSSASLSHSANLFLVGGVSRRTQPGDVGIYLHQGSSDRWKEITFSRADGGLPMDSLSVTTITNRSMSTSAISTVTLNAASASISSILLASIQSTSISASVGSFGILKYEGATVSDLYIQAVSTSSAASASTSSNIPFDTSIPQNNEGENLFSLAITPRNAASILEIEGMVWASGAASSIEFTVALFLDNAADAFACGSTEYGANNVQAIRVYHEHTASTTSLHTYALRYGADSSAMRINHGASGNLGGTLRSWLRIRERL